MLCCNILTLPFFATMEGQANTENQFSELHPSDFKHTDSDQFHEMLSSDRPDNGSSQSLHTGIIGVNDIDSIRQWQIFGKTIPKNEAIFICQVVILYIIIITCIVNLSISNGDSNLWTALLSSSMGIMLPAPTLSRRRS